MGRFFKHLYLRGNLQQDIFFDQDDRIQFLNRLALSSLQTGTDIWAFELLDNHYHLVTETESESDFMHYLRMSYSRRFKNKYKIGGMIGGRNYMKGNIVDPAIDGGADLMDCISYVLRNSKRHGIMQNFYDYPWSSIRLYFSTPKPYKDINPDKIEEYIPHPHELPDCFHMSDSGLILPQDYVKVKKVEDLFKTKERFYSTLAIPSRREENAVEDDRKKKEREGKRFKRPINTAEAKVTDMIISEYIIKQLFELSSRFRYSPKTIIQMSTDEKVHMAHLALEEFPMCSVNQLARILMIPESTLRRRLRG